MQALQHLDHNVQLALERQRIAQRDHVAQVTPVDELHGDEELAVGFAQVVDGDDVGVLDPARRPRLA